MILNSFATLEIVGLFRLAFRLAEIPSKLLMPSITRMSTIAIPRVVGGDRKALKSSCIKLVKGTVYLRMLAVIGVAVCIPPFVPLIYGTEFGSAIPIFLALLPYHLFSALNVASIPLARVFKKTWVMTIINTTGMCIAIGLCYLLFPLMAPVFAIIIGILYYHAHSLLLLLYLWWIIRTQKKLSV